MSAPCCSSTVPIMSSSNASGAALAFVLQNLPLFRCGWRAAPNSVLNVEKLSLRMSARTYTAARSFHPKYASAHAVREAAQQKPRCSRHSALSEGDRKEGHFLAACRPSPSGAGGNSDASLLEIP